uniref:DNA mismatch repair protein MSH6 n=1 Tax=Timema tahoe TaxID=61484 RepID=A0A7R9FLX7_9NEOP|nr:unnamed protein product [Timema tahoe]
MVSLLLRHVEMYKKKTDKICPLKYSERWQQASAQAESALLVSMSQRCQLLTDLTATKKEEGDSDIDSDESLDSTDLDNGKNKKMTAHPQKKRQLIYSDDDSEEEFKPKKLELEEESDSNSSGVPSDDISDQNSDIEHDIPVKKGLIMQPTNPVAHKITKQIAKMLAMSLLPYEFVEEEGFINLMKHVVPNYKVPCRTTFSRNYVPALYDETKQDLKCQLINDLPQLFALSLTSDGWTSRAHDSYISLTCHYLKPNFEYKSFTMNTVLLNESHTAVNIRATLQEAICEWGIALNEDTLPIYCVSDNAPNFRSAVNSLFISIPCFAHSLQLAIHDAKAECPGVCTLLTKAKAIVGHYSRSPSARKRLHSVMEEMGLPVLELIQFVDTRWSSEYNMLSRLHAVRKAVGAELANSENNIEVLTAVEWKQAAGIVEVLGPLADATKEISGDSYPTSSMVIPILHCLKSHLNVFITSKKDGVMFARSLDKALKSRFSFYDSDPIFCPSMLCDPRFRGVLIDDMVAVNTLAIEVKKLSDKSSLEPNVRDEQPSCSSSSSGLWSSFDSIPNTTQPAIDNNSEVKEYLNEPRVPRSTNPYIWWREEGCRKYPNVSKVKKRKQPPGKNRDSHKKMKTLNGTTPSLHDKSVLNLPSTSQTVGAATKIKLATLPKADSGETLTDVKRLPAEEEIVQDSWSHLKYDFLKPEKIRDGQCRLPSDPEYNPRTLFVPQDFKNNLTPAMRQWWDMKCQHFDCVLFFKVGKFYELYHMDAVIGFNELNLMYMKGDHAHSGFPEIAYGRFSSSLIEKGYKVARVEQTETPDMMANRCKNNQITKKVKLNPSYLFVCTVSKVTKFDKVVKREICQITTRGTKVFSVIDGEAKEAKTNFLLALTEKVTDGNTSFGICFIDTSIGVFHLGQFDDDRHFSSLRTLLAHYPPVQVSQQTKLQCS